MSDIAEDKSALRVQATERRRLAHAQDPNGDGARQVRDHALRALPIAKGAVIGGYWPMNTEMDVRLLLGALHERGHTIGLPHVQRGRAMTFHRWHPKDALVRGVFGIAMPDHHTPEVKPDILFMPVLAFDRTGNRLGYGGGYNDRTIVALRAVKPLLCVGIAYAAQEFDYVPHDALDQRLDWMVTEREARRAEKRRMPWLRKFFGS